MTATVCMTVDVEDFYDGMAELGEQVTPPPAPRSGLAGLTELLAAGGTGVTATLFVVGNYAPRVVTELRPLVELGHEVACHGPDHGRLPPDHDALVGWLRAGRSVLEDLVQVPVLGFRSPRFDLPTPDLARYRHALAEAGFTYVSDRHLLGPSSPVGELPVLTRHGIPVGGGSYQRLLPAAASTALVGRAPSPVVLYYHSYDFGATLPPVSSVRSMAMAKQLVGRNRVAGIFSHLLGRFGSEACHRVL